MFLDTFAIMPPIKALGLLGAGCYIVSYILLTSRVLTSEHWCYFLLNLTAATLVMISLSHEFNAASAVIQTFWIGVSLWGLATRFGGRRAKRPSANGNYNTEDIRHAPDRKPVA